MIYYNALNKTYASSFIDDPRLSSGFATREAGDGRNIETALSFLRISQVIFRKLVVAGQIHSANVALYESSDHKLVDSIEDTDGIVTREKEVALAVRTADCVPLLYSDTEAGVIGVSHNGWRGTLKNISKNMLDTMERAGARRDRIKVALGPGIGACCYDVDEDRYFQFMEEYETDFGAFSLRGGKKHLNLTKLNWEILKRDGVKPENIDFFPFCTSCNRNRFYSFRRDYKMHRDKFGEMLSYIVLN